MAFPLWPTVFLFPLALCFYYFLMAGAQTFEHSPADDLAAGLVGLDRLGSIALDGMLTGTGLAVFFVPIFFVVVRGYFKGSERQRKLHAHELGREMPPGATAGDQV